MERLGALRGCDLRRLVEAVFRELFLDPEQAVLEDVAVDWLFADLKSARREVPIMTTDLN